jgi:dihydrolipoamide dehydrogenase
VPSKVPIPGVDLPGVINSDGALSLEKLPKSILFIGGGVIGMEFAQVMKRLDDEVTVVEMLPQILPTEEEEIAKTFAGMMQKEGIEIHTSTTVSKIEAKGDKKLVSLATSRKRLIWCWWQSAAHHTRKDSALTRSVLPWRRAS